MSNFIAEMQILIRKNKQLQDENSQQKATISTLERLALEGGAGHDAIVKKAVELQAEIKSLKNQLLTPCVTCNAFIENDELKKFIEDNNILDMSEDLNYRMAILDGSWPQSVEILTRALENAKALKGQKDDN